MLFSSTNKEIRGKERNKVLITIRNKKDSENRGKNQPCLQTKNAVLPRKK